MRPIGTRARSEGNKDAVAGAECQRYLRAGDWHNTPRVSRLVDTGVRSSSSIDFAGMGNALQPGAPTHVVGAWRTWSAKVDSLAG